MNPPISIRCTTYGRPKLLNELVESFLRQDYKGKKELVILNDMPCMEYEFQHPEVRVINQPKRYGSLGEKHNAGMRMIKYDVTMAWDDDDILMPWTISTAIEKLGSKKYLMLGGYWRIFLRKPPEITFQPVGIAQNAIYTKDFLYELGGFVENLDGCGEDTLFRQHVRRSGNYIREILSKEKAIVIYRQGDYNFGRVMKKHAYQRFGDHYDSKYDDGKDVPHTYVIKPGWKEDYVALTRKWIAEEK